MPTTSPPLHNPEYWAAVDAERERYIVYMLGNDEMARRFWEEWLVEEIERRTGD